MKITIPIDLIRKLARPALLLAATAAFVTLNTQAAGKGNGGNVGGDVSGWIFSQVSLDDFPGAGIVSDTGAPYVDGQDLVEALVGRNFNIRLALNTKKGKRSRSFQFPNGFTVIPNGACAALLSTPCEPQLSDAPVVCSTTDGPDLLNDRAVPAEFEILGQDHDDSPVGCVRHVNARLRLTDKNGQGWWVFFGSKAPANGVLQAPCSSCVTIERKNNVAGKAVWSFFNESPFVGYLYRDNQPPHFPSELVGIVSLPFSGTITSLTSEPEPDSLNPCLDACACPDNTLTDPLDPLSDPDRDGVANYCDNCPTLFNPRQEDADSDGVGDVCE